MKNVKIDPILRSRIERLLILKSFQNRPRAIFPKIGREKLCDPWLIACIHTFLNDEYNDVFYLFQSHAIASANNDFVTHLKKSKLKEKNKKKKTKRKTIFSYSYYKLTCNSVTLINVITLKHARYSFKQNNKTIPTTEY